MRNSEYEDSLSRKAEASIKRLSLQGYVVNKPTSLDPTGVNELERKARIFRLPSKIDPENTDSKITEQFLPSLIGGSEDDEDTPKREVSEANDYDTSAGTGVPHLRKNSSNIFTTDDQAGVIIPVSDNTTNSAAKNDTLSERPRVARVEAFQPTVKSDGKRSTDEPDYLPLDNLSSTPDDKDETTASDKPPSVQSNDKNNGSRDYKDAKTSVDQEAKKLRQVIKEELAAALGEQKDHEVRFEAEMRERLAQLGFPENQIRAMLGRGKTTLPPGMTPNIPLRSSHQPTYVKVPREHLELETLQYYEIPFEIDRMNPEMIVILQEMDPKDTEVLFDHTRRIRAYQDSRLSTESRDRQRENDFVSRKPHPRHKPVKNHGKSFHVPAEDSLGPIPERAIPEFIPSPTDERVKANLDIPPFLAWPTTMPKENDETVRIIGPYESFRPHIGALPRQTSAVVVVFRSCGAHILPMK